MKTLPTYEDFLNESTIDGLDQNSQDMVKGIAEILRLVKDKPNRITIAKEQIKKFKDEGIDFKYEDFLALCDLKKKASHTRRLFKLSPQRTKD